MQRPTRFLMIGLLATLFVTDRGFAQNAKERVGSDYLPSDAVATLVLNVSEAMSSPMFELYPTEVADALCKQNVGILASDIEQIKVVIGPPESAMVGAVFQLRTDLDVGSLNPQWVDTQQPMDLDGNSVYELAAVPGFVMHVKDSRTILVASENYLPRMLSSVGATPSGPMAKMAAAVPHTAVLTGVIGVEQMRPMLNGMIQAQAGEIPPPLAEFTRIPNLIDAMMFHANPGASEGQFQMVMLAGDESQADECLGIITNGIRLGQQLFLSEMDQDAGQDDAVAQASYQYMQRMSDHYVEMLTPKQNGRRLTMTLEASQGMVATGFVAAMTLPAVGNARAAARRISSANNLKQIALAMHNYNDVHGKFPTDVTSADGTPLLSWRVAILPYLEEQALYEQFKLDEPWDSPNNLPLMNRLPGFLQHPEIQTAPGTTVYQRPRGEGFMNGGDAISFRNVLDGTSNTIMGVETVGADAVEWTKPADIQLDIDNPVEALDRGTRREFNVMLGDGSVRLLSTLIDPEVFKALLTRAGGEIINDEDLQ
ncbi:MAG: DUF1559 domain-containing protein [Rubripirellula sp.]|nr:DUF1559 domain-containing protein [Rubripirellula sp.]